MGMLTNLAAAGGAIKDNEWKELPEGVRALPDFPVETLPDNLAAFVRNVADAYQAPDGLVAAFALGIASAAIVGRVEIQPKHDEPFYREAGQMYILVEGASGERKTPVLSMLKNPLEEWLDKERKAVQDKNKGISLRVKALDKRLSTERDTDKAMEIGMEIDELKASMKLEPEYLMSDLTMEAVAQAMSDHQGKAAVVFDEADFLAVLTGKSYQRYGAAVNLLPALAGYTNGSLHGKRIGRGEWHIPRASLAICLGAQPKLLREFMEDTGGIDRGLHARFLYFLPESKIGKRTNRGAALSSSSMAWWTSAIHYLAGLAREEEPTLLSFDTYAEDAYRAFADKIEPRLAGDMGGAMQSWGGKLVGNTVRLAGILALLDHADVIDRAHWDSAEVISESYLIPCAAGLFLGVDPYLTEDARKVLDKIKGMDSFSQADLWRSKVRSIPLTMNAYLNALDCLALYGYIRKAAQQPAYCGRGSKPSPVWEVNPALRKRDAQKWEEKEL